MAKEKQLTEAEMQGVREYRRNNSRKYWDKMTPEERKQKRHEAYRRFWDKMTDEERKAKRLEYDYKRAMAAADAALTKAE